MTTAKSHLRPVRGNETAPRRRSVAQAAQSGDRRELLVAMRDRIAKTISDPDCPPRDLASLTRRLQDIAREIDQFDVSIGPDSVIAETDDESFDAASV